MIKYKILEKKGDAKNRDAYYGAGEMHLVDMFYNAFTTEEFRGYCKGNAIKYLWRYDKKWKNKEHQANDLEKAIQYIQWLIEATKTEEEK
jgi:hypothetical protein